MIRGSYANGFAPRDYLPAYPQLWTGCVGAWCPSLGPTGATLFDWSGFRRHGALTNFTLANAWPVSEGRYGLRCDGSNDFVNMGTSPGLAAGFTVSMWFWSTAIVAGNILFGDYNAATGTVGWAFRHNNGLGIGFSTGSGGGFTNDNFSPAITGIDGAWHFIAAVINPSGTSGTMYYAARPGAELVADPIGMIGITASSLSLVLGSSANGPGTHGGAPSSADFDDIRLYNRCLSVAELRLLSMGRGIAYMPEERRSYASAAAGFNSAWARSSNVLIHPGAL